MERTKKVEFKRTKGPFCKCGCGGFAKVGNKYIHGHYAKDPNGYNKSGWHHSEKAKLKLRNDHLGLIASPETKLKMSISHKNNPISFWKGKKHSEETKQKIRESIHKTYQNPEIRKKCGHEQVISDSHKKAVKEYMLNAWQNPEFRNRLILENASGWMGGLSFEPYTTEFNKQLKTYIKERDNYTCQNPNCIKPAKYLNVHHIDYIKTNCNEFNLITICCSCNSKANYNRESWKHFYQKLIKEKYYGKNKKTKVS
jgi:hypothetical protein